MKLHAEKLKAYFSHPLFLIIAGIIPCILSVAYYFSKEAALSSLEEKALFLSQKKGWVQMKKKIEDEFLLQLKIANKDYIENHLEKIQFLSPEIKKLHAVLNADPQNQELYQRLQYLEGTENHLLFKEQHVERKATYQETLINQQYPVEMNQEDLHKLIASIENFSSVGPRPPYLIINKFELTRKNSSLNEETFLVNIQLIKREMLNE